jgi:hypothetical protein
MRCKACSQGGAADPDRPAVLLLEQLHLLNRVAAGEPPFALDRVERPRVHELV